MNAKLPSFGALVVGLSLVGCGGPAAPSKGGPKAEAGKAEGDHGDHGPGPHGGTVIELGKYHGEFVVDHGKKQATVYILDGKVTGAAPITAGKLLLSIKEPQFQVDLLAAPQEGDPKGKASRFSAVHANFGKEQEFEGTVSGEIDGKPYVGDFKEEEPKDHKHEKKK